MATRFGVLVASAVGSAVRLRARWRAHQHRPVPTRSIFIGEPKGRAAKPGSRRTRPGPVAGLRAAQGSPPLFPMVTGSRVNPPTVQAMNRALTFLTSLRHDRLIAPFRLDGPINGDAFPAGARRCLAPTLVPGATVVADTLASHKDLPAHQLIRNAGARPLFRFRGKPSTGRRSSPSKPPART